MIINWRIKMKKILIKTVAAMFLTAIGVLVIFGYIIIDHERENGFRESCTIWARNEARFYEKTPSNDWPSTEAVIHFTHECMIRKGYEK